ncbi:MAG: NADH-quinone oxidoreductase subunit D [Anaeromyxobacteraceae bacterium]
MDKLILRRVDQNSEEMILNFGPQHPSTHGVINFLVQTDGEVIRTAVPDVGYLHRGIEKIGEIVGYSGFMPYTDRVDYVAAMFANEGYAIACERLLKLEVPLRAQYLRAVSCELCRIASHLVSVGTMTMDIGAFTPMLHGIRERETINDLIEELCGARLTYNYHRIGGVAYDLPEGWRDKVLKFLDHFDSFLPEFDRLISFNEVYVKRLANVAVISHDNAIEYGLAGPNLRASGVDWDIRRDLPYGAYPSFKFDVPVGKGFVGVAGDAFDRFYVKCLEMAESSKIVRQALEAMPEGEIIAKVPRKPKPEAGEATGRVESARGEIAYFVVSDGTDKAYRVRARTGSFMAMGICEDASPGLMIADLVALIASLDVVAPEIDR